MRTPKLQSKLLRFIIITVIFFLSLFILLVVYSSCLQYGYTSKKSITINNILYRGVKNKLELNINVPLKFISRSHSKISGHGFMIDNDENKNYVLRWNEHNDSLYISIYRVEHGFIGIGAFYLIPESPAKQKILKALKKHRNDKGFLKII